MRLRNVYTALLSVAGFIMPASAQMPARTDSMMLNANPWLHIYSNSEKTFRQYPMSDVLELRFDGEAGKMTVNHSEKGDESVGMSDIKKWAIGPNVPRIDIDTYEYCYEITSKTDYRYGRLTLDGRGIFPDATIDSMRIRGRGNSTWSMPKKPYRLKFKTKTKLSGMKKGKNYVLL
ncbi:MAG: hypothetical protein K2K99_06200, partial [Muribaculaceae bacterium]|nr:hypothetical protein [Muribaculaceae bacterium]